MSLGAPSHIRATCHPSIATAPLRRPALSLLFTIATTSYQTTCTVSKRTSIKGTCKCKPTRSSSSALRHISCITHSFLTNSEITPPRSEVCPSNIQVTTSTAITEIQKPKVVFRTGDGTEAPHICDLFGDKSSYNFTIGLHTITCRAFDPVFGDQAVTVCKFTIKIKRK